MWPSLPNIVRASYQLSPGYRKYGYQVCCIRRYSKSSSIPDLPAEGKHSTPHQKDDFPFMTVYDQFPHALQLFKFDRMSFWASLSSTKRIMLPAAVFVLSMSIMQEAESATDHESVEGAAVLLTCFLVSYFSATLPLKNLVGYLYIDQETEDIIVSYVDFWGRRKDEKFAPGDLYFKARGNFLDKLFISLISRKTGETFKIHFRSADVLSQELLEKCLGPIPDSVF